MKTIILAGLLCIIAACTKPEPPTPPSNKTTRTLIDTTISPAKSLAVTIDAVVTSGTMDVFYLASDSTLLHADLYQVGIVGIGYTVYQTKPCTRVVMRIKGTGNIRHYTLSIKT